MASAAQIDLGALIRAGGPANGGGKRRHFSTAIGADLQQDRYQRLREAWTARRAVAAERATRRLSAFGIATGAAAKRLHQSISIGETTRQRIDRQHSDNPIAQRIGVKPTCSTLMFVDRDGGVVGVVAYSPLDVVVYELEGCYRIEQRPGGRPRTVGTCFTTSGSPLVLGRRRNFEAKFLGGRRLADLQVIQIGPGGDEIASIVPDAW